MLHNEGKRKFSFLIKLFIFSIVGMGVLFVILLVPFVQKVKTGELAVPFPSESQSPDPHIDLIRVTRPEADSLVTSPLVVEGDARGQWFFEASFPVILTDDKGSELAHTPAQALDDWMTNDFVPFRAQLEFASSSSPTGFLILKKDNPSGLPEKEDQIKIPIRFY